MRPLRVLQAKSEALRARVQGEVAGLLGGGAPPAALLGAALHAHGALDEEGRRALARAGALSPACSAGCSYCCHVHVDATVPEILAIVEHVSRAFPPEALEALREQLAERARRAGPMSDEARWAAKIPCALLGEGGRCSIYEVRPLRCRAFHSCAVEPCREAFEGRGDAEPVCARSLERAHDAVEQGYDLALVEAGLSAEGHRLEAALLIALDDPTAGERWRHGAQVFARARPPRG
jgi:Fe-S-cluster containining protein